MPEMQARVGFISTLTLCLWNERNTLDFHIDFHKLVHGAHNPHYTSVSIDNTEYYYTKNFGHEELGQRWVGPMLI